MSTSINVYSICDNNALRIILTNKLKQELIKSINKISNNYKQIYSKL